MASIGRPAISPQSPTGEILRYTLRSPADAAELKRSLTRLKTTKVDLLQLHNVEKRNQSLARFKEWKAQGICRYVGITSTFHRDFPAVEAVLRREKPDFVQIDYSLAVRDAEKHILPAAADVKAGVLTALPFGRGRLFSAVHGQTVPDWASGFELGAILPEVSAR
jgi:aryl-alcohol dehydrogenase-like predicted oxidoreductase